MKKYLLGLLSILLIITITGCGNSLFKEKEANVKIGAIKLYVPEELKYSPELRGLIYEESERKLFIKGDAYDRSEAIIVDITLNPTTMSFSDYVERLNKNLSDNDVKYVRGSIGKMPAFKREKYTVTNTSGIELYYSNYLIYENNITHQIIITGPKKMQKELDTMMDDIVNSIKMANQ